MFDVIAALAKLVKDRPSRGFWKCRKMLGREGRPWNHKRIYRVYRAMGLHLRRPASNAYPSVSESRCTSKAFPTVCGRRTSCPIRLERATLSRTFNVVDDFNREAVHIGVDTRITSGRLVRVFEQLRAQRSLPQVLRSDNGPEFLGERFTSWAKNAGVAIQYIQPGKPNQENAYVERFNRTYREELLDQYLFSSLDDVREATWWWMREYNEERPHDALDDRTPSEVYPIRQKLYFGTVALTEAYA